MCGIIGYIGTSRASDILVGGLKRLEYRGYDSAGISTIENKKIVTTKCKGKINNLETKINPSIHAGGTGIGHTRWATHGEPNTKNAHPHSDSLNQFSLIHNGIIENHYAIKEFLIGKGIKFSSDTDSEVLVQLIGYMYEEEKNYPDLKKLPSNLENALENLNSSMELKEAFGQKVIESYIKLRNNEINNFNSKETFSKEKPITEWEKLNTLDC